MIFSYLCAVTGNVHIMGILNLTQDSFYAGSQTAATDVFARAQQMWADGATVVDLGACSTRPGAPQPSLEEEWVRLEPALREMAGNCLPGNSGPSHCLSRPLCERTSNGPLPLPRCGGAHVLERQLPAISIDTYRSEIVQRAYEVIGPFMVNDISAGQLDPDMLPTVGRLGLPYVAMHMRGTPETMQQFTDYQDLVADIKSYFRDFALKAADAGIADWLLDPGFGFSKTLEQNWELLRRLEELQELHRPILVGVSRKSMIYKALDITPEEALPVTQVVQYAALERGARWLRVHDVAEAVRTASIAQRLG
ncbi:MAG: dihydropteroate synthase [Bacteroidales bacterium]|nr:dihydropteroate synthase [Bacteroidales bacterium]